MYCGLDERSPHWGLPHPPSPLCPSLFFQLCLSSTDIPLVRVLILCLSTFPGKVHEGRDFVTCGFRASCLPQDVLLWSADCFELKAILASGSRENSAPPTGVSNPWAKGCMQPRMAMNAAQNKTTNLLKTFFFAYQFSLMFVYLTRGPRQLFFFQCGPETPKGWTPLREELGALPIRRDYPPFWPIFKAGQTCIYYTSALTILQWPCEAPKVHHLIPSSAGVIHLHPPFCLWTSSAWGRSLMLSCMWGLHTYVLNLVPFSGQSTSCLFDY